MQTLSMNPRSRHQSERPAPSASVRGAESGWELASMLPQQPSDDGAPRCRETELARPWGWIRPNPTLRRAGCPSELRPPLRLLRVSLRHLPIVCRKSTQNLLLFPLGHLEEVKRSPEFGRDFIELGGRDLQFAVGFFQAERSSARFGGRILLGSAGNVADPQGAHEFEARKSAQIVGVPFPKGRVL